MLNARRPKTNIVVKEVECETKIAATDVFIKSRPSVPFRATSTTKTQQESMPAIDIIRRRRDQTVELRLSATSEQSHARIECDEFINFDTAAAKDTLLFNETKQVKKTVRFHPKTTVRTIRKPTYSERSKIWLSPEELDGIRKECLFTVHCLSLDNMSFFLEDEDYQICGRGLENETPSGEKRRVSAKAQSRKAVLDEQWTQWYGGIYDDAAIADVYSSFTQSSMRLARIWGLKDEHEARTTTARCFYN